MRKIIICTFFLLPSLTFASTYGSNFLTNGTSTQDSCYQGNCGTFGGTKAFDNDWNTFWFSNATLPHWIKYQTATPHYAGKITLTNSDPSAQTWTLSGSNDDSSWTVITTGTHNNANNFEKSTIIDNSTSSYTYYKLDFTNSYNNGYINWREITMQECTDCVGPSGTSSEFLFMSTTTDQIVANLGNILTMFLLLGWFAFIAWISYKGFKHG